MVQEQFRQGIGEFNSGLFFECHDTLEDLWHGVRGEERLFLQGLIQISVGFYHLFNRNYKGAVSQLTRGISKIDRYRPSYQGIDLDLFTRQVEEWRALADRGLRGEHPSLDESLVPKIQLR
ncbi:MAG TPA: DUF309 domain-containing protein [Bacteroidota bacterium]|nr:DUF309 domain-containing protein [Bacteroidota bacterium]